jgi:hypothetical protein
VKIEILDLAERDLLDGFHFYEEQAEGLGLYFLENLYRDIDLLKRYAGIHLKPHRTYYRLLSRKFPFAVYYTIEKETVFVHAVVDCRRDPEWIRRHIG